MFNRTALVTLSNYFKARSMRSGCPLVMGPKDSGKIGSPGAAWPGARVGGIGQPNARSRPTLMTLLPTVRVATAFTFANKSGLCRNFSKL